MPAVSARLLHVLGSLGILLAGLWLAGCGHAPAPTRNPAPSSTAMAPMRPATRTPPPAARLSAGPAATSKPTAPTPARPGSPPIGAVASAGGSAGSALSPVLLGIDVLEAQKFSALRGKRVGLLTHPAGTNRRGVSTIDVLRGAKGVKLVALYGVEHGVRGEYAASTNYPDGRDRASGLPVYSLHNGRSRKPSATQLAGIDVLVIDLQDIGVRSYTYISAMKLALEACFENGKEVVVLDRPNPLSGLKVDGPGLDPQWAENNYVGAFRVPYVHGLTIGELAAMAQRTPGVLDLAEGIRARGRLTVIPMQGWRRSMRWADTGLRWIPTSPLVRDYATVQGYAMVGLGCEAGGFVHGIGNNHLFRTLSFRGRTPEQLEQALEALRLPGFGFSIVSADDMEGKPRRAVLVHVTDWQQCRPTELSFHLLRLAAAWTSYNPFAAASPDTALRFNKHCGSSAWWQALVREGARVNVEKFTGTWRIEAAEFQRRSQAFWLYR